MFDAFIPTFSVLYPWKKDELAEEIYMYTYFHYFQLISSVCFSCTQLPDIAVCAIDFITTELLIN